jgi:hypothetical protein
MSPWIIYVHQHRSRARNGIFRHISLSRSLDKSLCALEWIYKASRVIQKLLLSHSKTRSAWVPIHNGAVDAEYEAEDEAEKMKNAFTAVNRRQFVIFHSSRAKTKLSRMTLTLLGAWFLWDAHKSVGLHFKRNGIVKISQCLHNW